MILIPMRCLTTVFLAVLLPGVLFGDDRLRKVSGDAAPEKAQEKVELANFIRYIDSSVRIPEVLPVPPKSKKSSESTSSESASFEKEKEKSLNDTSSSSEEEEELEFKEKIQKADLLNEKSKEKEEEEVKELIKKTFINETDDFYITNAPEFNETSSEVLEDVGNSSNSSEIIQKTCIHVAHLENVDDHVNSEKVEDKKPEKGTKTGTLEVSVELAEEYSEEEDDADDDVTTKTTTKTTTTSTTTKPTTTTEPFVKRLVRDEDHKKFPTWKKFEMNCDEEEDEKGPICKLWAIGGLCVSHKPTMFLFCRRTCLCVGPS